MVIVFLGKFVVFDYLRGLGSRFFKDEVIFFLSVDFFGYLGLG